jgi:hypothetical protein
MKTSLVIVMCSALATIGCLSAPALAQQKTAAACRAEWQANKAANQANGVTERAYVAQCRGGATAAAPTAAAPAAPAARTPARTATTSGQKTAKECRAEWQANKAANQANGVTERAYVAQCRTGATPTTATAAPPPSRQTSAPPTQQTSAPPTQRAPATAGTGTPTGANEFTTQAQAKGRCPSDTVVWVNTATRVYHFSGYKNYGATKQGAYMCERDADAQGFRASKTEKRPGA